MFFFSNNFEIEILRHSNFQSDAALHSNIIVSTEKMLLFILNCLDKAYIKSNDRRIKCQIIDTEGWLSGLQLRVENWSG